MGAEKSRRVDRAEAEREGKFKLGTLDFILNLGVKVGSFDIDDKGSASASEGASERYIHTWYTGTVCTSHGVVCDELSAQFMHDRAKQSKSTGYTYFGQTLFSEVRKFGPVCTASCIVHDSNQGETMA